VSPRVEDLWGTAIGVDVRGIESSDAVDRVFRWFRRVDDLFSTWREDSEIVRIATGEWAQADASAEVQEVLALSEELRCATTGAFDIGFATHPAVDRQPGRCDLDPSGLVKGWALERAAIMLLGAGVADFTINAGGDVLTRGHPAPGVEWRVGIQHPWQRDAVAAVVHGSDLAVATSGRYERGEHIVVPQTGGHPSGLMAVTVVGGDLALADAYATAAVVLGDRGMEWIATVPGVEAMGITDDQTVVVTAGFDEFRVS
jgi:thiamine biosynthesis lipoprotein